MQLVDNVSPLSSAPRVASLLIAAMRTVVRVVASETEEDMPAVAVAFCSWAGRIADEVAGAIIATAGVGGTQTAVGAHVLPAQPISPPSFRGISKINDTK